MRLSLPSPCADVCAAEGEGSGMGVPGTSNCRKPQISHHQPLTKRAKWLVAALALLLATGCTDSSIIPIAGYWTGGFNAKPADPKVQMRPEWVYKGYLQLYATGMKYKMHMESVAQIVDVSGTWQKKKDKIYLTSNLIEFDDKGGNLQRPVGVKPLDPQAVRQAYGQIMAFNYNAAKHELDGLDMSMGPLIGQHVFTKGGE